MVQARAELSLLSVASRGHANLHLVRWPDKTNWSLSNRENANLALLAANHCHDIPDIQKIQATNTTSLSAQRSIGRATRFAAQNPRFAGYLLSNQYFGSLARLFFPPHNPK